MADTATYKDRPVGTLDELREMGMNPRDWGSCAPRTSERLGCPWYERCVTKDFRDGRDGKRGPCNIAVLHMLSPQEGSHGDQTELPCFEFFFSKLADRARHMDETGEIIQVVAVEGDGRTFVQKERVRAHEKRDPNCPACIKGECHAMVNRLTKPREVAPFKRPREAFQQMAAANEMRKGLEVDVHAQRVDAALAMRRAMGEPEPRQEAARVSK